MTDVLFNTDLSSAGRWHDLSDKPPFHSLLNLFKAILWPSKDEFLSAIVGSRRLRGKEVYPFICPDLRSRNCRGASSYIIFAGRSKHSRVSRWFEWLLPSKQFVCKTARSWSMKRVQFVTVNFIEIHHISLMILGRGFLQKKSMVKEYGVQRNGMEFLLRSGRLKPISVGLRLLTGGKRLRLGQRCKRK